MVDARHVGTFKDDQDVMQRRSVSVAHDKPRINDQRNRKVNPHTTEKPVMGKTNTGGTMKNPNIPPDNYDIEPRNVSIDKIHEGILDWFHNAPETVEGDAIAYQPTKDGVRLFHVKNGNIVSSEIGDSYDSITKKMKEMADTYRELFDKRKGMKRNAKRSGPLLAQEYAKKLGLTRAKIGELGRDIPVSYNDTGASSDMNARMAGAADPSLRRHRNEPSRKSTNVADTSPDDDLLLDKKYTSPEDFSIGRPDQSPLSTVRPKGKNSFGWTPWGDEKSEHRPSPKRHTPSVVSEPPQENHFSNLKPSRTDISGPPSEGEIDNLLKKVGYTNVERMTPWQKQQAFKKIGFNKIKESRNISIKQTLQTIRDMGMKVKWIPEYHEFCINYPDGNEDSETFCYDPDDAIGTAREMVEWKKKQMTEGYPDTDIAKPDESPFHTAGHIGIVDGDEEDPGKPALNWSEAEFLDPKIQHVHENANGLIDSLLADSMDGLGLTEEYEGFKKVEQSAKKSGARNPAAVAAAAGMKKYGKKKFEKAAHSGHKLRENGRQEWLSDSLKEAETDINPKKEYNAGCEYAKKHPSEKEPPRWAPSHDFVKGFNDHRKSLTEKKWAQKTGVSKHKGGLHKALHVPEDKKIPKGKLKTALHSKNSHTRHMAQFDHNINEDDNEEQGDKTYEVCYFDVDRSKITGGPHYDYIKANSLEDAREDAAMSKKYAYIQHIREVDDNDLDESTDKWIQKTGVKKPGHAGKLHQMLDIPDDKKIPTSELEKDIHSKNPKLRHRSQFALNVRK